jgi:hypothetical protein
VTDGAEFEEAGVEQPANRKMLPRGLERTCHGGSLRPRLGPRRALDSAPAPSDSAAQIKAFYVNNLTGIRIGMILCLIGAVLLAPFGAVVALLLRRTESGLPVLTYTQVICIGMSTIFVLLTATAFGVAAFRPDEAAASVTRDDLGWFFAAFDWPPFSPWYIAIAFAILRDKRAIPVYPRWVAYVNIWVAVGCVPASCVILFKTGAFAWNGLISYYVVAAIFFVWIGVMFPYTVKAINLLAQPGPIQRAHPPQSSRGLPTQVSWRRSD